jgi:FKBP-type peptidyl-prolyl cis-trans isomerase
VATSRRRERELARRRFERRRQAEIERRARNKKRNTVLGASIGTIAIIAVVVIVIVALASGSSNNKSKANAASTPGASTSPTPTTSSSPAPAAPTKCAKINPNPPAAGEPKVPDVTGKAPTKLVAKDLKVGTGPAAKSGDKITVKYIGISCSTGKVFDASYTDGATNKEFSFNLGQGQVIQGWDKGLVGMKAGGVRQLVIPAAYGYGTAGSPPKINGNETLIFLVTMDKV